MAERRPPGFNVDIGFYDSDEVMSIPRKIRAAAIGVWTLAGAYAANKLTDGHVSAEKLKQFGCTPAIRAALMNTTPEPLWADGINPGDILFTRWTKWQRTRAEVKAYREAEAQRKRNARKATRSAHTTTNSEMSGRTTTEPPPEHGTPKTETKTETEKGRGYVNGVRHHGGTRDPMAPFPRHCPKHQYDPDPPNCPDCGAARRAAEALDEQRANDAAERKRARRQEILDCPDCDDRGLIDEGNHQRRCPQHDWETANA